MRIRKSLLLYILVVGLLLSFAVPAAAQDAAGASAIEITLESQQYQAVPADEGAVRLEMEGFQTALIPGYPALPVRIVDIALPSGTKASGIVLRDVQSEHLGQNWHLTRVPAQVTDNGQFVEFDLTEPFPSAPVVLEGTHALGGIVFARLHFYPFRYDPGSGELALTRQVSVSVRYTRAQGPSLPMRHGDLESLVVANEAQARDWYTTGPQAQAAEGYLILTSSTLANSTAVQNFVSHKSSMGFSVYVSTPADWSGFPGGDGADRIRNFLINRYGPWNLRWLLIIGSAASIPMKTAYPSPVDHASGWPTPTDAYYADLTGNWDADGDGYFGERGEDSPDFTSELWVGRIPFDGEATVGPILQKTETYATTDGDWRRTALLAMAIQGYTSSGAIQTDGGYLGEQMRSRYLNAAGVTSYRLYEENTPATSLPHEGALTLANMKSKWASGYGLVTWWGHGNRYGAYRRLWSSSGFYDTPFITYDDLSGLDNTKPSIVFQNSCLNAETGSTNLSSELLKKGAVGAVGGTTLTWYYLNWDAYNDGGNATLGYLFGENLVSGRKAQGQALADAKSTYAAGYVWFTGDVQNLMSFTLHGDPSVGLWPSTVTLEKPLDAGWNLISFSNLSSSMPVAEAFASIEGSYSQVYSYDRLVNGGSWLHYTPGGNPGINTLATVDGLHGYWVQVTSPCILTLTSGPAAPSSPAAVPLYAGWNLVSFPRMTAQPVSEALSSIAGVALSVFASDESLPNGWARYNPSTPAWASGLNALEPGVGYWVKVSSDTLWTP